MRFLGRSFSFWRIALSLGACLLLESNPASPETDEADRMRDFFEGLEPTPVPNMEVFNLAVSVYLPHLKFNMNQIAYRPLTAIDTIVIHHTAGNKNETVQSVHRAHLNQGWAGIGYHYFIDADGKIFKGRNNDMVGSHCYAHNTNSLGVCLAGNFEIENPTEEQVRSLKELVELLRSSYPNIRTVQGHCHYNATACPGSHLKAFCVDNDIFLPMEKKALAKAAKQAKKEAANNGKKDPKPPAEQRQD